MPQPTPCTLICLVGGQLAPNYLAARQLQPESIVLCYTSDTAKNESVLRRALKNSGIRRISSVRVDPFDLEANFRHAEAVIAKCPGDQPVIVNYTGGTKQMAIAFYVVATRNGHKSLYVDSQELSFLWSDRDVLHRERIKIDYDLKDHFLLHDIVVAIPRSDVEILKRSALTNYIFHLYETATAAGNGHLRRKLELFFASAASARRSDSVWPGDSIPGILTVKRYRQNVQAVAGQVSYSLRYQDHTSYFAGGWLEEWTYLQLRQSGWFDDVAIRVTVLSENSAEGIAVNEIDVAAIKDGTVYLLECKSGKISRSDIYRIRAIADSYGGRYSCPLLVSLWEQAPLSKRCGEAKVALVKSPSELANLMKFIKRLDKART